MAENQHRAANIQHPASKPRPFIIPIFIPHAACPHQCVFCNQVSITGAKQKLIKPDELRSQICEFLTYQKKDRKPAEIAFFGGNFLGLEDAKIKSLLATAAEFIGDSRVDGIRFSTRPDTINDRTLKIIKDYPVSTVELGVQSMNDQVLVITGRGHSASHTVRAVERLKLLHLRIGLQMMVGLPGDDASSALTTTQKIIELRPDFVRIYPTLVVANTRLARWYKRGDYTPLSLEAGVTLVKKIYLKFNQADIKVIRMGLQASGDLEEGTNVLAGPYHPAFGHMVYSEIFLDTACAAIKSANLTAENVFIFVNPRRISIMRGLKNKNIELLKGRFGLGKINIIPDITMADDSIKIDNGNPKPCFCLWR